MELKHWILLIYLAAATIVAVIMTIHDKLAAIHHQRRVPETTLMITAALSGCIGMYVTMQMIRHKTKHIKFMLGIPVIFILELAGVIALFFFGIL